MEQINQNLHGYLRMIFRRKWMLIIPTFTCFILAICLCIILPREYRSSTTILVQEGKTDNPLFENIAISSSMTQRTQAIRETILGWDSLVKLIKRLNLDQGIKSNLDFERLIEKLRLDIIIVLRQGNIIDLKYSSNDPQKAKDVVQTVTDIFIERNMEVQNKETEDAIKFIQTQLNVYRGKIKSTEIADLKDKLNVLLVDSTEAHPLVKQLREQINSKLEELKKDNLQYSEESRLTVETTNPIISEIKKSLDSIVPQVDPQTGAPVPAAATDKDVYKILLLDKLDNVMARDVDVNNTIYNSLLQRLETAKITQRLQSSKEGTKYTILDPPRVPLQPSKPNVWLVLALGLVLGIALGGGMIFLFEFLDKSFLDVQEASTYLEVPLLGAISKINTQETLAEEQEHNKWLMFWMVTSGALLITLTLSIEALIKH